MESHWKSPVTWQTTQVAFPFIQRRQTRDLYNNNNVIPHDQKVHTTSIGSFLSSSHLLTMGTFGNIHVDHSVVRERGMGT